MGDSRRFQVFAEFIKRNYKPCKVADVAGGKGILSWELQNRGYKPTVIDPRIRYGIKRYDTIKKLYKQEYAKDFDLIVGMHPDSATEDIIESAIKYNRKFAIVPCCSHSKEDRKFDYKHWIEHLKRLADYNVKITSLDIKGRNLVIFN